jgi:hypothetical protein
MSGVTENNKQPDRTWSVQFSVFVFRRSYVQKLDPETEHSD